VTHLRRSAPAAVLGLVGLWACSDEIPTSADPGLIPVQAETFEVTLPLEAFAVGVEVHRGFGAAGDLPTVFLGAGWEGEVEIRPLFRFLEFPASVGVIPPGGSVSEPDSSYLPVEGRVVLSLDTLRVDGTPPFRVRLSEVSESWHPVTASWTLAVDTLGDRRAWSVPGGGPLEPLAEGMWDPAEGDTLVLPVDSLTLRRWREEGSTGKGLVLASETEGSRLRMSAVNLRVDVRSEVNPDTLIQLQPASREFTVLFAPEPDFPDSVLPVGGAPSHRTTFHFRLPSTVEATGSVCRGPSPCQVELSAERVVYAGLRLTTVPTEPRGLAPADSMTLDLRPVLAPERLPRSPLGGPLRLQGIPVTPSQFAPGGSAPVEIAVTRYLRDVIRGEDVRGEPVTASLSLMTIREPASFGIATFAGPGSEARPRLRIILTVSEGVGLP
jgi:hypothetical protein